MYPPLPRVCDPWPLGLPYFLQYASDSCTVFITDRSTSLKLLLLPHVKMRSPNLRRVGLDTLANKSWFAGKLVSWLP